MQFTKASEAVDDFFCASSEALNILGASSREKMPEFKQAIKELALAGITKSEIMEAVDEVFKDL